MYDCKLVLDGADLGPELERAQMIAATSSGTSKSNGMWWLTKKEETNNILCICLCVIVAPQGIAVYIVAAVLLCGIR